MLLTVLSAKEMGADGEGQFDHGTAYYGSVVFGTLALCVSVTGWKTYRMLLEFVLSTARRQQVTGVTHVIAVYCAVFLVRTIWDVLYACSLNPLQDDIKRYLDSGDTAAYLLATLFFFTAFEVLPTLFLLFTFIKWVRPQPRPGSANRANESVNQPLLRSP